MDAQKEIHEEAQEPDGKEEAHEEVEEEGDFEMLDMLCDTVEVDDYKANKAKELKMMNAIMDERRRQREKKEETRKF